MTKAIFTQYKSGGVRSSYIRASDLDGRRHIKHEYDPALSLKENHERAAIKFARRMEWKLNFVPGWLKNGYAWVYVDGDSFVQACMRKDPEFDGDIQVNLGPSDFRSLSTFEVYHYIETNPEIKKRFLLFIEGEQTSLDTSELDMALIQYLMKMICDNTILAKSSVHWEEIVELYLEE